MKVAAVVVTFNRPAMLARCLTALRAQERPIDELIIVDNGNTGPVDHLMQRMDGDGPCWRVLRMEENTGPAGGFAAGTEAAMKHDPDALWVMDDDVFPDPDCLKRLLPALRHGRLLAPTIIGEDGRSLQLPAWAGYLIDASLVRQAGPPRADLFWWAEDTEYLRDRLPRLLGRDEMRVPEARVVHATRMGERRAAWQYYFETRNSMWLRLFVKQSTPRRLLAMVRSVVKLWCRAASEPRPSRRLHLVHLGILDGFRGRLGKRFDPATEQAKERRH